MENMKPTQGVLINVKDDVTKFIGNNTDDFHCNAYKELFSTIEDKVEQLAAYEEVIMQKRCINNDFTIKLSTLREYVYARCPFYRRDKSTNDIRVIIGRIDLIDPNNQNPSIDDMYKNEGLMAYAKTKLIKAMNEEHINTLANYSKTYYSNEIFTQI